MIDIMTNIEDQHNLGFDSQFLEAFVDRETLVTFDEIYSYIGSFDKYDLDTEALEKSHIVLQCDILSDQLFFYNRDLYKANVRINSFDRFRKKSNNKTVKKLRKQSDNNCSANQYLSEFMTCKTLEHIDQYIYVDRTKNLAVFDYEDSDVSLLENLTFSEKVLSQIQEDFRTKSNCVYENYRVKLRNLYIHNKDADDRCFAKVESHFENDLLNDMYDDLSILSHALFVFSQDKNYGNAKVLIDQLRHFDRNRNLTKFLDDKDFKSKVSKTLTHRASKCSFFKLMMSATRTSEDSLQNSYFDVFAREHYDYEISDVVEFEVVHVSALKTALCLFDLADAFLRSDLSEHIVRSRNLKAI